MTLTDAGPLVALLDINEAKHEVCRLLLPSLTKPLVSPWPCYTEAMYLIGKTTGYPGQKALWRLRSSGRLRLKETTSEEADQMEALMEKYKDTPMDLADASLVIAAQTLGLRRIFTLDRHFYTYRLLDGSALEVLP